MLKLFCKCGYDDCDCDKVIPKIDEAGCIIEPEKDMNLGTWEVCKKCKRNHSVGACSGYFELGKVKYPSVKTVFFVELRGKGGYLKYDWEFETCEEAEQFRDKYFEENHVGNDSTLLNPDGDYLEVVWKIYDEYGELLDSGLV